MNEEKNIDIIEFHIVEYCNLNCKSCMHFSPIASKTFVKVEEFKKDARKIASILRNQVKTVHLLGGEPLLHPKLEKIIKITRQYFPNSEIMLISNGILLTKQKPSFWHTLKMNNIHLSVTKYPLNINYNEISHLTKKYGIKYTFYASDKENSQWHFPLDIRGEQDCQNSFDNCSKGNNCTNINITNGKLYVCPIIAYSKYFNNYFNKNLLIDNKDYLLIKNIKNIDEIKEFISNPKPFCRYCDIKNRTFNNKWEISKKEISEWT